MPVLVINLKRSGSRYSLAEIKPWLGSQRASVVDSLSKPFDFFLDNCSITYGPNDQDKFMTDFQVMMNTADTSVLRAYIRGLDETRTLYQKDLFASTLAELNQRDDGRVKFAFLPKGTPDNADEYQTIIFRQNTVGMSKDGKKNLYTDGFMGCTGVLVTPADKAMKGGILGHIAQTGKSSDESMEKYLLDKIDAMLSLAQQQCAWVTKAVVDVTVFFGDVEQVEDVNASRREVPDLANLIKQKCKNAKIGSAIDLRPFREHAGQFLFVSGEKTFYLLADSPPNDYMAALYANIENVKEYVEMKRLMLGARDLKMSCYFVK